MTGSGENISSKIALLRKPLISYFEKDENYNLERADNISCRVILRLLFLLVMEKRGHFPAFKLTDNINNRNYVLLDFLLAEKIDEGLLFALLGNKTECDFKPVTLGNIVKFFAKLNNVHNKLESEEFCENYALLEPAVLGEIYEIFLEKRAIYTDKGNLAFKKDVAAKKSAGVFYTPDFVIDYILENTLQLKLEGLSVNNVSELRLLDPACGSGCFLLAAIDLLFKWHVRYYLNDENYSVSDRIQVIDGAWSLSPKESARIVSNNIYGVDLDLEAVNISKLSILLMIFRYDNKCPQQGETECFVNLDGNLKCGNSLIETSRGEQLGFLFDDSDGFGNTFNWDSEFLQIFSDPDPGFDVIIGNPPYRRELDFKGAMDEVAKSGLGKKYRTARMDYWYYFVHRGIELLKKGGELSFITSSYWIANKGAAKLIEHIRAECAITEIFMLGKSRVFKSVSGQHMIFRLMKTDENLSALVKIVSDEEKISAEEFINGAHKAKSFYKDQHSLYIDRKISVSNDSNEIMIKLSKFPPLEKFGIIRQGIAENPASINRRNNQKHGNKWEVGEGVFALSNEELKNLSFEGREAKLIRPYYDLSDLDRYFIADKPSLNLIYSTAETCPDIDEFPRLKEHLVRFREIMESRRETKSGSNKWWHLHWPREEQIWKLHKIVALQMAKRPSFAASKGSCYTSFSTNVFVPDQKCRMNYYYLTGVLNSKLLWLWFKNNSKRRGVGLEISGSVLAKAPIHEIDYNDNKDIARHNKMVTLVGKMMTLKQRAKNAKLDAEKYPFLKQIKEIDEEIDKLVIELYGFSEKDWEEILKELDLPV